MLRRYQFGKKGEHGSLLEEAVAADIAAIEQELKQLTSAPKITEPRAQPKRAALPPQLPLIHIHHEPENTTCACGGPLTCIGEDVAEKLDYIPGVAQAHLPRPGQMGLSPV